MRAASLLNSVSSFSVRSRTRNFLTATFVDAGETSVFFDYVKKFFQRELESHLRPSPSSSVYDPVRATVHQLN